MDARDDSPTRQQRVLVVDDDESVRRAHARYVEQLGYEAETASDGLEALTKLALGIDLVLLDLYMPGMDGFEVAARVRAHPKHSLIPIIMITGSDKEAWYPRALEIGCNAVMAKPINAHELRLNTRWLMELKTAHDRLEFANTRLTEAVDEATSGLRHALRKSTDSERRIYQAHLDTIKRLTIAAEYRDETVAGHLARVGMSCAILADVTGFTSGRVDTLRNAAPLHDVGMIGIPDSVLLKDGPLDEIELALVREHTHIGGSLLSGSESEVMQMGATIALRHHERWDGSGYPEGLAGEAIPIEARICSVVDYFDSSTMHRPYRRALPEDEVIADMEELSGRRFDPTLLDAFFACLPEIREMRREYPV